MDRNRYIHSKEFYPCQDSIFKKTYDLIEIPELENPVEEDGELLYKDENGNYNITDLI